MAAVVWLNSRLGRQPALAARHVGRIVAFNGVFPITLIGLGFGLVSAGLWASLIFKVALALAGLASLALLLILCRSGLLSKVEATVGETLRALVFEAGESDGRAWGWVGLAASGRGLRMLGLPANSYDAALRYVRSHYADIVLAPDDPFLSPRRRTGCPLPGRRAA